MVYTPTCVQNMRPKMACEWSAILCTIWYCGGTSRRMIRSWHQIENALEKRKIDSWKCPLLCWIFFYTTKRWDTIFYMSSDIPFKNLCERECFYVSWSIIKNQQNLSKSGKDTNHHKSPMCRCVICHSVNFGDSESGHIDLHADRDTKDDAWMQCDITCNLVLWVNFLKNDPSWHETENALEKG